MQALRLVETEDMTHDEWLEWRRKGIGGSDVAAICGLSRYKSALEVYLDKIGEIPPKEDNPKMKAGRILEPVIADWFTEETGIRVQKQNCIFQSKEYPFMLANIDRWVIGENAGLEIKNTSEYNRNDWFDGQTEVIPTEYQLQANHYMAVLGAERWYVAVLIGGWDFQWRVIERDDHLIANLITIEQSFWQHNVLGRNLPQVTAQDTDLLNKMYPTSKGTTLEISEIYYDLIKTLLDTKKGLKQAEEAHEDAKNKVKKLMGENELALWQGEKLCTWKTNSRGSRVFKIIGGI
ncbi:YqaJ viral recombinase family protein [Paenibacillus sp. 3LSP]|uniref:YqaJ viral recombinase family nuclease n=1 Tax=Paenibacillus sp. 3LSP TaxID=2800795 RepID=UPI0028FD1EC9|nr:YqaJ viral recombinase family protein [Paenibacillus sp. 3LSP]MDU0329204.1 YqaJ viral recombinase family protein [Paenibacillus sp. 3LSP]